MFASVYIYRVSREKVKAFLRVQRQAAKIYRQYGALDDETWGSVDLAAKYGCSAFGDSLTVAPGEDIFLGLSRFRDEAHHDEVMRRIDSDPRINELYDEVTGLLDVRRIVRGEFERVA